MRASRPATFLKRDRCFSVNIAKILRTLIFKKIWEQLLLPFLLLTTKISPQGLVPALNSIGLLQRSSSMFEEFSLGCLVVDSSLIWKKEKLAEMVTRHSLYHSLSFVLPLLIPLVVTRCTTRLSFYKHPQDWSFKQNEDCNWNNRPWNFNERAWREEIQVWIWIGIKFLIEIK